MDAAACRPPWNISDARCARDRGRVGSGGRVRELQLTAGPTVVASTVGNRAPRGAQPWKAGAQSLRLELKQSLGFGKPGEAMATETSEPDPVR